MTDWSAMETPLDPVPVFPVQEPDGRKDWPEIQRQTTFLRLMGMSAPSVLVFANANAGKRNPRKAKAEGIMGGVFDITCIADGPLSAFIEFKGYTAAGRPGILSRNQVEFGNRCHALGVPVACFFSPYRAYDWLKAQGFPCREVRHAA